VNKYFIFPRKRFRWTTIHTTMMIALFLHFSCLCAYAIFRPETQKKDYEFFEVKVVEPEEVKEEAKKEETKLKMPKSAPLVKDMEDYEPAPAPTYKEVPSLPSKAYPTVAPMNKQATPPSLSGSSSSSGPPVLGVKGDQGEFREDGGWGQGNQGMGDGSGVPDGQGWGGPITGGDGAGGSGPGGFGGGNDFGNTALSDKIKDMRCLGCKVDTPGGASIRNRDEQPQLLNFENAIMRLFRQQPDQSKARQLSIRLKVDASGRVLSAYMEQSSGIKDLDDACIAWGKAMKFATYYEDGKAVECEISVPVLVEPKQSD